MLFDLFDSPDAVPMELSCAVQCGAGLPDPSASLTSILCAGSSSTSPFSYYALFHLVIHVRTPVSFMIIIIIE